MYELKEKNMDFYRFRKHGSNNDIRSIFTLDITATGNINNEILKKIQNSVIDSIFVIDNIALITQKLLVLNKKIPNKDLAKANIWSYVIIFKYRKKGSKARTIFQKLREIMFFVELSFIFI